MALGIASDEFDAEPADLVAELDDEPPADLPDDPEGDPPAVFSGAARGGPWDGMTVQCRYPKGFLLIDMQTQEAWIYDRADDGSFIVRDEKPMPVREDDRWRAAEESNYDLLVPGMEMG